MKLQIGGQTVSDIQNVANVASTCCKNVQGRVWLNIETGSEITR